MLSHVWYCVARGLRHLRCLGYLARRVGYYRADARNDLVQKFQDARSDVDKWVRVQAMLLRQIEDMWQDYYASLQGSDLRDAYSAPACELFTTYSRTAALQQEWKLLDTLSGDAMREQTNALTELMQNDQLFTDVICNEALLKTVAGSPLHRLLNQVIIAVNADLAILLVSTLGRSAVLDQATRLQHGSEYYTRFATAVHVNMHYMREREKFIPALLEDWDFWIAYLEKLASPRYFLSPPEVTAYGFLTYGRPIQVLTGNERDHNDIITVSDSTESGNACERVGCASNSGPPAVRVVQWNNHYERAELQSSAPGTDQSTFRK